MLAIVKPSESMNATLQLRGKGKDTGELERPRSGRKNLSEKVKLALKYS
jgi:hypothetical protein